MPTVPELKEQLTHYKVEWKQSMLKPELEKLLELAIAAEALDQDGANPLWMRLYLYLIQRIFPNNFLRMRPQMVLIYELNMQSQLGKH